MSQQAEEYKTPIYLVTGFLESGKTSLIKNMLEDEDFSAGERTLLIVCEEGEEEYDAKLLRKANTVLQEVESFEDLTPNLLNSLNQRILPERVIIEYNSMWGIENLFRVKKPDDWELAQMVALIDATTFENYMVNMRQLMSEAPKLADLVKIDSGAHEVPPKERGDGQAGKERPKARRRLRASGRRAAGGWRHAASFLLPGCDGPRRKDKVAYPAPYGI